MYKSGWQTFWASTTDREISESWPASHVASVPAQFGQPHTSHPHQATAREGCCHSIYHLGGILKIESIAINIELDEDSPQKLQVICEENMLKRHYCEFLFPIVARSCLRSNFSSNYYKKILKLTILQRLQ